MSVRVVLDTNVIISAALTPGPPALCVEMALKGIVTLVVSEELLEEYAEVLARPR